MTDHLIEVHVQLRRVTTTGVLSNPHYPGWICMLTVQIVQGIQLESSSQGVSLGFLGVMGAHTTLSVGDCHAL